MNYYDYLCKILLAIMKHQLTRVLLSFFYFPQNPQMNADSDVVLSSQVG